MTSATTPPAADWLAFDTKHCWHPFTQHGLKFEPLTVQSAQGSEITLVDGQVKIDAIASWWCNILGHAHPALVQAMSRQASTLDHVLFAGCAHEPAARLSELLVRLSPPNLNKVFFSDNGSTAVEVALKMSFQSRKRQGQHRPVFIALEGGYHGDTLGAMSVGDPDPFFEEFKPLMFEVVRITPDASSLQAVLETRGSEISALVLEPCMQGAGGMIPIDASFLQQARAMTQHHDVHLIADEVFVGMGRCGHLFASAAAEIKPDFVCLAKGLTNGMLPFAVTLTTDQIYDCFQSTHRADAFFHGHTMTANPIGCAVALECLQTMLREDTPNQIDSLGASLEQRLRSELDERYKLRRKGGIVAFTIPDPTRSDYLSTVGDRLRQIVQTKRSLLRPLGNVLYAVPPASTTPEQIEIIAADLIACVHELQS